MSRGWAIYRMPGPCLCITKHYHVRSGIHGTWSWVCSLGLEDHRLTDGKPGFIPTSLSRTGPYQFPVKNGSECLRKENPNHRIGNSEVWKCALTRKDSPGLEPPFGEEITEPVTWRSDELMRTLAPSFAGFMVVEPHQLLVSCFHHCPSEKMPVPALCANLLWPPH